MMTVMSLAPPPTVSAIPCRNPKNPQLNTTVSPSTSLQCQHFNSCSGCSYEWNLDRPPLLHDVTNFFNNLGVSDFTFHNDRLVEWRCRAKLAVRGSSDRPLIGLYQEDSHNIVDIPHCRAHHPSINAAVDLLKQGISKLNIQPYDEDLNTGELRYVQMAVTTYDTSVPIQERYGKGKVQISLVWNSRNECAENNEKLNALSRFLWRIGGRNSDSHLIHSIWANFQTSSTNIIFGSRWRHLLGEREFWEHIGGIDFALDPSSFGQANTQGFNSLLRKLQKYVPFGSSFVDLYAGAGTIGLSLAATRKCRSVKCVEINKDSKTSFEKSVGRLPKSVESSISWHNTDASIEPLHWLEGSDVIVVDPPRKGLDPTLIAALQNISLCDPKISEKSRSNAYNVKDEKRPWILRAREASIHVDGKPIFEKSQNLPKTLIYISCGWENFKEDCRTLLSSKTWRLENAHAFNLFPGTQSIEILAVFKCGRQPEQKKKLSKKKKTKKHHEVKVH